MFATTRSATGVVGVDPEIGVGVVALDGPATEKAVELDRREPRQFATEDPVSLVFWCLEGFVHLRRHVDFAHASPGIPNSLTTGDDSAATPRCSFSVALASRWVAPNPQRCALCGA